MTLNLKIEVLKVFSLELNFDSSDKKKKEAESEKDHKSPSTTATK